METCNDCQQERPKLDSEGVCGYCAYRDARTLGLSDRLMVRVPGYLRARLLERVQEHGVPLSVVVRYLLEIGLEVEDAD